MGWSHAATWQELVGKKFAGRWRPRSEWGRLLRFPVRPRAESRVSARPPYLRQAKRLEELLPWLYLKGISTGDFSEALAALLGPEAPGLSASTINRLKQGWVKDYETWRRRDLSTKHYVYVWADGIYANVRFDDARLCPLVLMAATTEGKKELIAVAA